MNVSEGRDAAVLDALAEAADPTLLDRHVDADHHRSVFTIAGDGPATASAVGRLLEVAVTRVDLSAHAGAHPRLGAVDVVPFVALGDPEVLALEAATGCAVQLGALGVPVFLYGAADPQGRDLPSARRDAFVRRPPDVGPDEPHPRLGASAVGVRPPLVAVNCWLDRDDLPIARAVAGAIRGRDGGLPGVRALAFRLPSRSAVQVSLNVTDLAATGVEAACTEVRARAEAAGIGVAQVEWVGLVPAAERERTSPQFRAWSGLGPDLTIEARLARSARA